MLVYEPTAFRDSDGRVAMKFFGNFASAPGGSRVCGIALKPRADLLLVRGIEFDGGIKMVRKIPHEPFP